MAKSSARISFVTPSGKREKLDQIAQAFGTNLSSVINDALDHYIHLHEWQLAHIQKGVDAAHRGDFADDQETARFFTKYGSSA